MFIRKHGMTLGEIAINEKMSLIQMYCKGEICLILSSLTSILFGGKMGLPKHINPIIKLTERCNYNCAFCRYAIHKQYDSGISEQLAQKMIEECVTYNRSNGIKNTNVIFHGGEPLLYGVSRLSKIVEYIDNHLGNSCEINYSIQTNGYYINPEWIDFFKKHGFDVGISLDGPVGLNGHICNSPTDAVVNAVNVYRSLRSEEIPCGFLSVITEDHLTKSKELFKFYVESGIESVGLCYCFNKVDGNNVNPERLGQYLIELYELYFNSPKRIHIREFDLITRRALNRPHNACSMSCRESCGCYLTLTPDGNVEFCDDYDLDRKNAIGNLSKQSLVDILNGDKYHLLRMDAKRIIYEHCSKCEVYDLCKGGCARNDVNNENFFCPTFKILYPYIAEKVRKTVNEH